MSTTELQHQKQLFGHPIGLYVLFLTEMWERFSYYGMRALLVLYMTASTLGDDVRGEGLGWTIKEALALYGWYNMFVYVMSIPGGTIADKLMDRKGSFVWCCYSMSGSWCFSPHRYLGFLYRFRTCYTRRWITKTKYFYYGWRTLQRR